MKMSENFHEKWVKNDWSGIDPGSFQDASGMFREVKKMFWDPFKLPELQKMMKNDKVEEQMKKSKIDIANEEFRKYVSWGTVGCSIFSIQLTHRAYFLCSYEWYGVRAELGLTFTFNDILVIFGPQNVEFEKSM